MCQVGTAWYVHGRKYASKTVNICPPRSTMHSASFLKDNNNNRTIVFNLATRDPRFAPHSGWARSRGSPSRGRNLNQTMRKNELGMFGAHVQREEE